MSDYNLDALGWYQFERLCQALLRAAYGAHLEAWGGSGDLGRDAYCSSALRYPDPEKESEGPFVFQAKFVANANAAGADATPALLKAVRAEAKRIERRIVQGHWTEARFYTLLTNAPMKPDDRRAIQKIMGAVLPNAIIISSGCTDISASLDDHPNIRVSYPQVLGLRDLQQLVLQAVSIEVRNRSSLSLDATARLAQAFVPTAAYTSALRAIGAHGFAVLTGPPEMGKTATARILALARFTSGWEAYETRHPDEVLKVYRRDARQVFVADDAFGSTEYRPDLASAWGDSLEHLLELTDRDHSIVWTSRPGPLREALRRIRLQGLAEEFPEPSQVQVDASKLSVAEKAQMLYRHAKAAGLDERACTIVRKWAWHIVSSQYFTPLRIQRLVRNQLPVIATRPESEHGALVAEAVEVGLQEPTSPLRQSFEMLDDEHRALLLAMVDTDQTPVDFDWIAKRAQTLGASEGTDVKRLARDLDEQFIRIAGTP